MNLFKPIDNIGKTVIGILESYNEQNIILNCNENRVEIQRENISQIKTVYEW